MLKLSRILKCVAASAAKAKLGALFLNAMEVKILRITLKELGYPQRPTPIHWDNTTAVSIVISLIKQKISQAMNMRYFWLLCQQAQRILQVSYHPSQENLGNYQSKVHNGAYHKCVSPFYIHSEHSPSFLQQALIPSARQGCVGIS